MADCSLYPVTLIHHTTESLPRTAQPHSTSARKYETALLPHVSLTLPGTLYITARMQANSSVPISIHQNHDGRPSVEEFQSCKVQACLGTITAIRALWSACQEPDLSKRLLMCGKLQSDPLRKTSPENIQIPNEQKMCEKSHCGKSFLCIFTPVRREDRDKRRMEMRMKWARHERHILQEFVKRGRRQWLLLFFFPPMFFLSFFGPCKGSLALFVIVFLHSCWGCDHWLWAMRDLSLMRAHTHKYTHTLNICKYFFMYTCLRHVFMRK